MIILHPLRNVMLLLPSLKRCEIESKIQEQTSGNGGDKGMNSPTKHGGKRKKTYSLNIESPQKKVPINDISRQQEVNPH